LEFRLQAVRANAAICRLKAELQTLKPVRAKNSVEMHPMERRGEPATKTSNVQHQMEGRLRFCDSMLGVQCWESDVRCSMFPPGLR
jgi:hypothetical protein